MSGAQLYDTIGATYTVTRRTEPRIAARVWAALGDARSRCSFRGTALMASSRPTGADPRHTWTMMYVAEYRCGPESGRRPSSGQWTASVMTLPQGGGPNATATSWLSRQQSLASACS